MEPERKRSRAAGSTLVKQSAKGSEIAEDIRAAANVAMEGVLPVSSRVDAPWLARIIVVPVAVIWARAIRATRRLS